MKCSLFLILAAATTAIAASITPAHVKTVDAATYKAIANGTLSLADLPLVAVIFVLIQTPFPATDKILAPQRSSKARCRKCVSRHSSSCTHLVTFSFRLHRYMCTAAYWQEYCVYITDAGPGECVNLAGDLNNLVSSIGPDPNQECYLYE
jgi:hypothetical protein